MNYKKPIDKRQKICYDKSVSILYVSGSGNANEESPGITEQDS